MILQIDDKIISAEILTEHFCCDLAACQGRCCVEGNSGAPLEREEIAELETEFEAYRPYLTPEGLRAIEEQGTAVIDIDGDLTTPLVDDAECAYAICENGITLCAIEKAFLAGETEFRKPISCHLYPIRVARFSDGSYGLNYHRWDVCRPAVIKGVEVGIPIYKMLREPLIRKFGEEFFNALKESELALKNENLNC